MGISPFGEVRDPRPRALFFAHDSLGLGHIRRTLALAGELARRRPDVAMLVVTSSFLGGAWHVPANLDLIKLPSLSRSAVYTDHNRQSRTLPRAERRTRGTVFYDLREQLTHEVATSFDPWVFVADNEPIGIPQNRELLRTLTDLRAGPARTRLLVGLRDIYDTPEWVRESWPRNGILRALEELYEQILIYGDPSVFDTVSEFRLPPSVAAKIVYTGYIRKNEPLRPVAEVRASLGAGDRPLVVVTIGGGGVGIELVRAYLGALAGGLLPGVESYVLAGPLMSGRERAGVLAAGRVEGTRVEAFEDDLASWLHAADVVVSLAGYNTVTEALSYGTRLVLAPLQRPGEQVVRATRLAARGLARVLLPDELSPERLAREVLEALAEPAPTVTLDFGGLERAGELMAAALG